MGKGLACSTQHGAFNNLELQGQALMDENGEILQRITVDFVNDHAFLDCPEFGVTRFDIITLDLPNGNQACILQILTKNWATMPAALCQQALNLTGVVQPPSHAFGGIDPSDTRRTHNGGGPHHNITVQWLLLAPLAPLVVVVNQLAAHLPLVMLVVIRLLLAECLDPFLVHLQLLA
jgi:hypothetical protein